MSYQFFVSGALEKAGRYLGNYNGGKLESNELFKSTDLISEGPLEGLVDKDGNLLKYIDIPSDQYRGYILGKGIYYNDVPLIDSKLNKFNFITAFFDIDYGEEFKQTATNYPSTIYRYNQKIYLNDSREVEQFYQASPIEKEALIESNNIFCFKKDANENFDFQSYAKVNDIAGNKLTERIKSTRTLSGNQTSAFSIQYVYDNLQLAKENCQPFIHKIKNKYCDNISIQLKIDQLFNSQNGNTKPASLLYAIELIQDNSIEAFYLIGSVYGISKSAYSVDIPINLNLNSLNPTSYYVKIYPLSSKILPTDPIRFKDFSVSSIIERVLTRGYFSYPLSSIVKTSVSSRHFNSEPARTYDMKLLKIKVPKNYDPECSEYSGNWDGNFDYFLRWTDNPAWIFYDICTNSRYGVGNGKITQADLNKWELYKISKYCDELVKTSSPHKYNEDNFEFLPNTDNRIRIKKDGRTLDQIRTQYPPVSGAGPKYATQNGGMSNSIIYLYDLKDSNNTDINKNYKKIIWSVNDGNNLQIDHLDKNDYYYIHLINDFGPRKAFEKETDGNLLSDFIAEKVTKNNQNNGLVSEFLKYRADNTENGAKSYILNWYAEKREAERYKQYIQNILVNPIFDSDIQKSYLTGKCMAKAVGFREPLEKRFSCNLYIDNESECLKLLNDISSVFRGLTYYKNNYITATIDVDKSVSYLFNNTNVKEGLFNYGSAAIDGNYTVAKVMFKDRFENFTDQVEIVENSELIKEYGIVIKEILGFGITSRDQARRIGEWMLLTNLFENQTVTFVTDLQGLNLKPSDIIQIEDQYKNDSTLQGRMISRGTDYIVVDRKLNLNLTGKKIKFIIAKISETPASLDAKNQVTDTDVNNLSAQNTIEFTILRIENNTNRLYLQETTKITNLLPSTPFIIQNDDSNQEKNLYKIISISEIDNNEYSIFCIKHDPAKYQALTKGSFSDTTKTINNTINFSNLDNLTELTEFEGAKYFVTTAYKINEIPQTINYSFAEQQLSLSSSTTADINILSIDSGSILKSLETTLDGGGILIIITLRNQSIKIKCQKGINDGIINVFLGKYTDTANSPTLQISQKVYTFDKNNKIT